MAHVTASSYFVSASVRQHEPACTKCQTSSCPCCCIMKPKPCLLASGHNCVDLFVSKRASSRAVIRHCFVLAIWLHHALVSARNHFLVLSCGRIGAISPVIFFVPDDSWLTNPMKDRNSDRLIGVGK